jgi:hypothetical protein
MNPALDGIEPGDVRYNVVLKNDRGGFMSCALAEQFGRVVSTVNNFDGEFRDLALIDIAAEDAEAFETLLDADENVAEYRTMDS